MAFADLIYYGALASTMLVSSVLLLIQFLRGDLTERRRTSRLRRTDTPFAKRRPERSTLGRTTRDVRVRTPSHARHVSPQ